jgi:hypothetical protein
MAAESGLVLWLVFSSTVCSNDTIYIEKVKIKGEGFKKDNETWSAPAKEAARRRGAT